MWFRWLMVPARVGNVGKQGQEVADIENQVLPTFNFFLHRDDVRLQGELIQTGVFSEEREAHEGHRVGVVDDAFEGRFERDHARAQDG